MPKIRCGRDDCKYNEDGKCRAKKVLLVDRTCWKYKERTAEEKKEPEAYECEYLVRPGVCGGVCKALCGYMNHTERRPGQPPRAELNGLECWCDRPNVTGKAAKTETETDGDPAADMETPETCVGCRQYGRMEADPSIRLDYEVCFLTWEMLHGGGSGCARWEVRTDAQAEEKQDGSETTQKQG